MEQQYYRQYEFSQDYMNKLITDFKLSNTVISPNGDGVDDNVSGEFSLTEKVGWVAVFIVNELGTNVAQLPVQNPVKDVSYTFSWNGKDERGNSLYNGRYYAMINITKDLGHGSLIVKDKPISLVGAKDIVIPQPVEKVSLTNNIGGIAIEPTGMEYMGGHGKAYPILAFEIDQWKGERYLIKVADGVVGYVKVSDVEMVEYDKLPTRLGKPAIEGVFTRTGPALTYPVKEMLKKNVSFRILRKDGSWYRILLNSGAQAYLPVADAEAGSVLHPVVAGDTLWKLAQRYGVTIDAIAKANNISTSAVLAIGQQLLIPAGVSVNPYTVQTDNPDIRYIKLSSRTIGYDGINIPGYLTIDIETTAPARGYIDVKGGAATARINLSSEAFKNEHVINWVPWDDAKKQPLPAGEYELTLQLTRQDGTNISPISLGKLNVVEINLPKAFVSNWNILRDTITPTYGYEEPLTTIFYGVSRHAMGQIIIRDDKREYFHSPLVLMSPHMAYSVDWNGRDEQGELMPNGNYTVEFRAIDLDYNYPDTTPKVYQTGKIVVYGSEYRIPEARIRQVVKEVKLSGSAISPNGDGVMDTISGTVTFNENTRADIWIINSAGVHIKQVLPYKEYTAGTHGFTWDGKDFMNSGVFDGTYGVKLTIMEGDNYGSIVLGDLKIMVSGSYQIEVPKPEQRVRVIAETMQMTADPMGQGYTAKKDEIFTLLAFTINNDWLYKVRIGDSATGYVRVDAVEMIDLHNLPGKWGKVLAEGTIAQSMPGNYYQTVEILPKDVVVRILRQDDTWYRVLLNSGKQAYVKTSALVETTAPSPVPGTTYTVVPGDTLWKISQKFSVTVDAIIRANNITATTPLMVGQKLVIPSKPSDNVMPKVKLIYTVKAGDSLWKIAQANSVSINEIVIANKLTAANELRIGQQLVIPVVHIVKAGDALWKIASLYQTTTQRLIQLNNLDISKPLYIGQRMIIST